MDGLNIEAIVAAVVAGLIGFLVAALRNMQQRLREKSTAQGGIPPELQATLDGLAQGVKNVAGLTEFQKADLEAMQGDVRQVAQLALRVDPAAAFGSSPIPDGSAPQADPSMPIPEDPGASPTTETRRAQSTPPPLLVVPDGGVLPPVVDIIVKPICADCKHFDLEEGQAFLAANPNFMEAAKFITPNRMGRPMLTDKDGENLPDDQQADPMFKMKDNKWTLFGACEANGYVCHSKDTCDQFEAIAP